MSKRASAPAAPGFIDLVRVEKEVFSQYWGPLGGAGGLDEGQVAQLSLEPRVGEDGYGRSAVGGVNPGQTHRVEVGAKQAAGGGCLLDLGDEANPATHQSPGEVKGPWLGGYLLLEGVQRRRLFLEGQLFPLGCNYFVENVGHIRESLLVRRTANYSGLWGDLLAQSYQVFHFLRSGAAVDDLCGQLDACWKIGSQAAHQ